MGVKGCYVEILNPEISTVCVETNFGCNNIIEVINTDIILPSSFPDVEADKIIGLNEYIINHLDIEKDGTFLKLAFIQGGISQVFGEGFDLDSYLDYYSFDGGSP
jgi:hypothetical protein